MLSNRRRRRSAWETRSGERLGGLTGRRESGEGSTVHMLSRYLRLGNVVRGEPGACDCGLGEHRALAKRRSRQPRGTTGHPPCILMNSSNNSHLLHTIRRSTPSGAPPPGSSASSKSEVRALPPPARALSLSLQLTTIPEQHHVPLIISNPLPSPPLHPRNPGPHRPSHRHRLPQPSRRAQCLHGRDEGFLGGGFREAGYG